MSTALVIAVTIVVFGGLAAKYWTKTIGAGPTILIVGVLCLFAFWGFTYTRDQDRRERDRIAHDAAVADYATCVAKVDRSFGNRDMWQYVLSLFHPSTEATVDFTAHLDEFLPALTLAKDCPTDPNGG